MGSTYLGSGAQILGNITVQDCHLEGGVSFEEKPVNARGSVLKGFGIARKISLKKGEVINGNGIFKEDILFRLSTLFYTS
ncbi:MAG: hypothetical protein ACERKZ_05950 [Lachnotalea sp.]